MKLNQTFKENKDQKWIFITQGGNQGDHMIYAGARKLADRHKLDYREVKMGRGNMLTPKIAEDTTIYIQGGGGWCTWWNWTPRLVNHIAETYPNNHIIVGPSTVALQDWYIDKWLPTKKITFIAREDTTYNYMKKRNVDLHLDQDTALHLKKGDKWLTPLLQGDSVEPFKLAAIREDPESPDKLPESVDLGDYDIVIDPCQTKLWGQLHVYATEILTNRSHSAILGAILGKKTKMFKGKYHKNRSIWKHSLEKRGVEWVE